MSADVVKTAEEVDANIKAIIARTGYSHEVTSGQRKYGGPPPSWDGTPPGPGHEVFCGKIPKDVLEDELIPLFEDCGTIWDLRLMMDPASGTNRSFCFVTFTDKAAVEKAVKQLDGYQIRPGKKLKVNPSTPNSRLFVGNIPKSKSKDDIMNEFSKVVENITEVIIYNVPDDPKKKNRGFTFLDFDSHKSAANAKKRLSSCRVFGCDIIVDWADPLEEPSEETMSKVKVLYVRNLKSDVSEQLLRSVFEVHGAVEKVKKVKDYGFVHFAERDDALRALEALNGTKVNDSEMMVSLAKPPTDAKLKEKRKLQHMLLLGRAGFDQYGWGAGPMVAMRGMPRGGRMRLQPPMRGNYRYAGGPRFTDYYPANYDSYGGYMYQDDYSTNYSGGYEDYGASYDDSYVDYYSSGPYNMNQSGPALRGRGRGGGNYQGLAGGRGAGPTSFQPQFASRGWARGGRGQRVFGATATHGGFKRGKPGLEVGGMGDGKKSMDGWCSQPIAQQPLGQTMSGGFEGCGGDSSGAEWYNDSYPPQSAMATHAW